MASTLSIVLSNTDVILHWTDDAANLGGYDIHRSATSFITPDGGNKLISTRPPGTATYTDAAAIAGGAQNIFYIVNSLNCDTSTTAASNEIGVFSLELIPGTP